MTENESRKKWCPMSRVILGEYVGEDVIFKNIASYNRAAMVNSSNTVIPNAGLCLASDCACWDWDDDEHYSGHCGLTRR